jgi:mono/diheme cytochrome c family protein
LGGAVVRIVYGRSDAIDASTAWGRRLDAHLRDDRAARLTPALLLALAVVLAPSIAHAQDVAALYRARCAVCHGAEGRGDGPAAALLTPRPRDFTTGVYKFRSTPSGTLPTEADVLRTITRGLPGTSMPPFGDLLGEPERRALARHVLAMAPPSRLTGAPLPVPFFNWRPAVAVRGGQAYERAGCGDCHGADGRGEGWRPKREGPTGEVPPTNLTEPWSFRGGAQIDDIALRILGGIDGSPMPSFAGTVSRDDALVIAAYVLTLGREPIWRAGDAAAIATAGVATEPLARGRYLVNAVACTLCHTPASATDGAYDARFFLAGGMRVSAYPWGVWYSRNLTPDADTGLGQWSEAEIVTAITRGIARDGRRLDPMAMPWPWFSRLTPEDARAIATYLKALPPIRNDVPRPRVITFGERAGGKLLALAGAGGAIEFWGGNAATDRALVGVPASAGRRIAANVLGWGSAVVVFLLTAAGFVLIRGRGARRAALAGGLLLLLAWVVLALWPPLRVMSPERAAQRLLGGMPALPRWLTGPERALAERGEYLATVAPCGLCHTPASPFSGFLTSRTLAGGMEARWRVFGSAVSSNLTPHRDGIAPAAVPTLSRALRSGIGTDGRALHWQAMPWDIFSHWSEEDRLAMIAYLRALPPVAGRVPPPRPAQAGDPEADSFYFGDAARR